VHPLGDVFNSAMDYRVTMEKKSKKYEYQTCYKCLRTIKIFEEKFVCLGTYEKNKILQESYFHINCWNVYFNDSCMAKVRNMQQNVVKSIRKTAKDMLIEENIHGCTF